MATTTENAVDRALRLMSAGADIVHATNDAAHHFNCSARLVRAAVQARAGAALAALDPEDDEPPDPGQRGPCPGHEWAYTGTAYGGDDASYHGEGRAYCIHCGADGDA